MLPNFRDLCDVDTVNVRITQPHLAGTRAHSETLSREEDHRRLQDDPLWRAFLPLKRWLWFSAAELAPWWEGLASPRYSGRLAPRRVPR